MNATQPDSGDRRELSLRKLYHQLRLPASVSSHIEDADAPSDPPSSLIDAAGQYRPGWFSRFDGALNVEASSVSQRRLHRWFYVHFDTPEYFIGMNIADLAFGGNTGLVVLDKRSGQFTVESETALLMLNGVRISKDARRFMDTRWNAVIAIDTEDQMLDFDVRTKTMQMQGRARALFARPFVQSTRFHGGHGALQSWGNLELEWATLSIGGWRHKLPSGTLGAYDRSLGHRRPLENWNWLVSTGHAECEASGERVLFSVHLAKDRAAARPQVDARKYSLWLGEHHVKLHDLQFDYRISDAKTRASGDWQVHSSPGRAQIALTFRPQFHRRDRHHLPLLFRVDHSQYFGDLSGRLAIGDRWYRIVSAFAAAEDSRMIF